MENVASYRNNERFWFGRKLAWAGGAAFIGCAVSCSLPLLAVAAGGGALTSLTAFLKPGAELVVGGLVFAGALGVMAMVQRRKAPEASGCGCGPAAGPTQLFESPEPPNDEPVICTAPLGDQPAIQNGIDSYRAAFSQLITTERFEGGFRWRFPRDPGLQARLEQLIAAEYDCCRFFQFRLTTEGDQVVWETRAPAHAASVLEEFSRLPERLQAEQRRGHDVAALKVKANAAGLRFAADEVDRP